MQANVIQNLFNSTATKAQSGVAEKNTIPAGQGGDEFAALLGKLGSLKGTNSGGSISDLLQLVKQSPKLNSLLQKMISSEGEATQGLEIENVVSKQMFQNTRPELNQQMSAILGAEEKTSQKLLDAFKGNDQVVQLLKQSPELAKSLNIQVVEKSVSTDNPFQTVKTVETLQFKNEADPSQLQTKILNFISKKSVEQTPQQQQVTAETVDSQLLMQQFGKKNINRGVANAYGGQQQGSNDNIIKFDRTKSDTPSKNEIFVTNEQGNVVPMYGEQQFIPQVGAANLSTNAPQVLDLSNIQVNDTTELITKISDYIKQTQLQNSDSLELVVKHKDLGQFKINVEKSHGAEQINLQIATATKEGHEFFKAHQQTLARALNGAGFNLGEMKVVAEANRADSSSKDFTGQNGQNSSNQSFGESEQNQQQRDTNRRQRIWQEYKERFVA